MSNGAAGMNPMGIGMMMGMMAGPVGMPPMGGPPMGMSPMGMPPMSMSKDARSSVSSSSGDAPTGQVAEQPSGRSSSRRHEHIRLDEVEKFLEENRINEEASLKVRALSPASQRRVIARPLTGDVQNPSKVMIARVRELQSQNERMKGNDAWTAWNGAMMGATPEAISKYIEDNDLDESASRQLRSLPPHQQAIALRWDLSSYRNPSAKFMSMANGLGTSIAPRVPFPGMMSVPGLPMWSMGMRPMGLPAVTGMPGFPGMPHMPGMPGIHQMLGMPGT